MFLVENWSSWPSQMRHSTFQMISQHFQCVKSGQLRSGRLDQMGLICVVCVCAATSVCCVTMGGHLSIATE